MFFKKIMLKNVCLKFKRYKKTLLKQNSKFLIFLNFDHQFVETYSKVSSRNLRARIWILAFFHEFGAKSEILFCALVYQYVSKIKSKKIYFQSEFSYEWPILVEFWNIFCYNPVSYSSDNLQFYRKTKFRRNRPKSRN